MFKNLGNIPRNIAKSLVRSTIHFIVVRPQLNRACVVLFKKFKLLQILKNQLKKTANTQSEPTRTKKTSELSENARRILTMLNLRK